LFLILNFVRSIVVNSSSRNERIDNCFDKEMPTSVSSEIVVKRYYLNCLAQASYLVAHNGRAFVIDPRRDVDIYLKECQSMGVTLKGVLLTHLHADFVAGHMELAAISNVAIFGGERMGAQFNHYPSGSGDAFRLSDRYTIKPIPTPGHTPGCTTWTVIDLEAPGATAGAAVHAFTGDTLFVGGIGRPDLIGSLGISQEQMAGEMFESLHTLLDTLPHDGCTIWPGHGAGSPCGKSLGTDESTTLARQLGNKPCGAAANPYLALAAAGDRDAFVLLDLDGLKPAPAYFPGVVQANLGGPCLLADIKQRTRFLQPKEFMRAIAPPSVAAAAEGAGASTAEGRTIVIDTRKSVAFQAGHIAGSWNMPIGHTGGETNGPDEGNFGIWVGTLVPFDAKVFVVSEPDQQDEALERFARIGYEAQAILSGTFAECADVSPAAVRTVAYVEAADVAGLVSAGGATVVDVRTIGEYENGHYDGAINVQLCDTPAALVSGQYTTPEGQQQQQQKFLVYCRGGYRSAIAASIALAEGRDVVSVNGGYAALQGL
jgi:glyoxylase-like metal-dependent hydrolase (beta-lactamase superfamily II)/rhodanese-related sulfurtransferase